MMVIGRLNKTILAWGRSDFELICLIFTSFLNLEKIKFDNTHCLLWDIIIV